MKTIGFPKSHKENERRIALLPEHVAIIENKSQVYVETGYGKDLGFTDEDYTRAGVHVADRSVVLQQDVICDPKIGDAEYLESLCDQTIFGWTHAVQNKDIADKIINGRLTSFAWEDMYENGRHSFWRNNEIAGEAAIMHAYMCYGKFPYNTKVAVIGRGNVARGAIKTLDYMGATVICYNRHTESLLRQEIGEFDVIVNAILWDIKRTDHMIYREDLKRMKRNSMIIDISCDRHGGIETSEPTTIEKPTYITDGVIHYVVDHTPSIFYRSASESISEEVAKHIDALVLGKKDEVVDKAMNFRNGEIVDVRVKLFQNR